MTTSARTLDDPVLLQVFEELTERLQAGESVDIEDYVRRHPDHAEPLRRCLPAIEELVRLGGSVEGSSAGRVPLRGCPSLEKRILGDFRLIREVGRGGMGVVYEAEQLSLRRRVALKVLPFASVVDSKHLQRFQIEAQAAALLHHTNIVPIYSVGSDRGVHYYAMQFIEGLTLSEVIEELRRLDRPVPAAEAPDPDALTESLTSGRFAPASSVAPDHPAADPASPPTDRDTSPGTSTRTRAYARSVAWLGQQAAEALEHAHQQGILHRDIKPGNLLLDARGVLWVTDFGLARFQDEASLTMTGDLLGTLRYMSPEQATARRVMIDHRTDIYSLGVTLYELLTLRPAIEGGGRAQVLRRIAEHEPPPPHRLNPAVPRDLATIIQKAMAKDPTDRYDSAAALAEDLRRFLEGQTILARRPSLFDRASKWARRHTAAVVSAVGVLVLVVLGLAASNHLIRQERQEALREKNRAEVNSLLAEQRQIEAEQNLLLARRESERAEVERAIAEAVSDFLQNRLLAQADPTKEPDRDLRLRTVLDRAAEEINRGFDGPPRVEAAIHAVIGETYRSLGLYEEAKGHLDRAVELRRHTLGAEHPETLSSLDNLAMLCMGQGRLDEAESLLDEAIRGWRRVHGDEHPGTLKAMETLAGQYQLQGRYAEAEALTTRVLSSIRLMLGEDHHFVMRLKHNLARIYMDQRKYADAEPLVTETLDFSRRVFGPEHPDTLKALSGLANLYTVQDRLSEAEALLEEMLKSEERILGDDHPQTLLTQHKLAAIHRRQGRYAEAESRFEQVLAVKRRTLGDDHPSTIDTLNSLMVLYSRQGKLAEAEAMADQLVELRRRVQGQEHPQTLQAQVNRAGIALRRKAYDEAETLLIGTLEAQRRTLGDEHPETLATLIGLARLYQEQAMWAEEESICLQALPVVRNMHGDAHPNVAEWLRDLGMALLRQEKYAEAEPPIRECLKIREATMPDDWRLFNTRSMLGGSLAGQGKADEAEPLLLDGYEGMKAREPTIPAEGKPLLLSATDRLVQLYEDWGKPEQAERWRTIASTEPRYVP